MSQRDRYGDTLFEDRDRRWRSQDRERSSFLSSEGDDRGFGRGGERQSAGWARENRQYGRDHDREQKFRDNQPGRSSRDSAFSRHERPDRDEYRRGRRERESSRYGNDDNNRSLPIDETEQLIASNKVEGTPVYGREGERLGTIYNFMVDKYSGRVTYAVMSYGGFLGVGQRYYPVPWQILTYDTREGGYRVDMDYQDLERAPSFGREDEPRFNRDYGRRIHNYYGLDY